MKVINVPDPVLRKISKPIDAIDQSVRDFLIELGETIMHKQDPPGVGLSAVQVGHPIRAYYTYLPIDPELPSKKWTKKTLIPTLYINPTITHTSDTLTLGGDGENTSIEGCLSIPKIWGPVYRHEWIRLEYLTFPYKDLGKLTHFDQLQKTSAKFTDFYARVIQHEQDHLEGILFTDHNQKEKLPMYLETDDGMQEIVDPSAIITW